MCQDLMETNMNKPNVYKNIAPLWIRQGKDLGPNKIFLMLEL